MTVYDRDMLEAIRGIWKELKMIRVILAGQHKPHADDELPDLETYFERMEDDAK